VSGPVTSVARVEDVQIFLKDPVPFTEYSVLAASAFAVSLTYIAGGQFLFLTQFSCPKLTWT